VNLYITQLHIRSSILDQMDGLSKHSGELEIASDIPNERQRIVDDMLEILYQMPEETLEANGYSLVPKLRDIGSVLLHEVRHGDQLQGKLDRLLAKLERLDVRPQLQLQASSPVLNSS